MQLRLELSVGMADTLFFLSGSLPEPTTVLELCDGVDREVVMVDCLAGSCSVQMVRALRGTISRQWRAGQVLRWPLEFAALNGSPWWECSMCFTPVTSGGRDGHAAWHESMGRSRPTP